MRLHAWVLLGHSAATKPTECACPADSAMLLPPCSFCCPSAHALPASHLAHPLPCMLPARCSAPCLLLGVQRWGMAVYAGPSRVQPTAFPRLFCPCPALPCCPTHPLCSYEVRMAMVDLDNAPSWWRRCKHDNMSAAEARRLAGTSGARFAVPCGCGCAALAWAGLGWAEWCKSAVSQKSFRQAPSQPGGWQLAAGSRQAGAGLWQSPYLPPMHRLCTMHPALTTRPLPTCAWPALPAHPALPLQAPCGC